MPRRLLAGHRVLSRLTPRRIFALCVLATLSLLVVAHIDPRVRAGWWYVRAPSTYVVPVAGLATSKIQSTWHEGRSGGRQHEGTDLFAPRGTAVVSATNGVVWSIGRNDLGGNTVSVLGDGLCVYYYAHLDTYAAGLLPGDDVKAGDVLGGVGNTGDAAGLPTHLHFGVTRLSIFGAWAVDPAPLLANGRTLPSASISGGVKDPPVTHRHAGGREDVAMPEK
jgi:murein DD-endopeptidase MepM/ murein hydrolase activator NlpD